MKEELLKKFAELVSFYGEVVAVESNALSLWFETADGKLYWVSIGECET